jgi:hypothetical protein
VHSVKFVGVGACISPNSKAFLVKLGPEAIAVWAVGEEGVAAVRVPLDQQGSADMDAHVVQPLSWPETTEDAHCHLRGQVARNHMSVREVRGWGAKRQSSGNVDLCLGTQTAQDRALGGVASLGFGHEVHHFFKMC